MIKLIKNTYRKYDSIVIPNKDYADNIFVVFETANNNSSYYVIPYNMYKTVKEKIDDKEQKTWELIHLITNKNIQFN